MRTNIKAAAPFPRETGGGLRKDGFSLVAIFFNSLQCFNTVGLVIGMVCGL